MKKSKEVSYKELLLTPEELANRIKQKELHNPEIISLKNLILTTIFSKLNNLNAFSVNTKYNITIESPLIGSLSRNQLNHTNSLIETELKEWHWSYGLSSILSEKHPDAVPKMEVVIYANPATTILNENKNEPAGIEGPITTSAYKAVKFPLAVNDNPVVESHKLVSTPVEVEFLSPDNVKKTEFLVEKNSSQTTDIINATEIPLQLVNPESVQSSRYLNNIMNSANNSDALYQQLSTEGITNISQLSEQGVNNLGQISLNNMPQGIVKITEFDSESEYNKSFS